MAFQDFNYFEGKENFVWLDNFDWAMNELYRLGREDLKNCIVNSVLLFVSNNFVILPISVFCAYIFYKKLPCGGIFKVIFFLPNIISVVVLTLAFSFMFNASFGPVNEVLNLLGLGELIPANGWLSSKETAFPMILFYCLWAGIGYNVVLLSGAIGRIPEEVIESGKLDGIGMWRELFVIVIPLIFPTITTLFVTGVTVIFTLFLQPMLLTGGGPYSHISGTIALYIVELVNASDLYKASAIGLLFSAVGVPLVLIIKFILEKISPDVEY
jgi:multiple sugar transport system permease protein/N-acetylglucosamine transport system permease protein